MAQTADTREWGGGLGPQTHAPPTVRHDMRACPLPLEGVQRQRAREGTCCPAAR